MKIAVVVGMGGAGRWAEAADCRDADAYLLIESENLPRTFQTCAKFD